MKFLRMLGQLVRRLTQQAGDLVFLDLPGWLAKLLLQLVGQHGAAGGAVLDRGLTQSDLAAMIGASRPAVNRALQSLVARGYLGVHGQAITLRDVEVCGGEQRCDRDAHSLCYRGRPGHPVIRSSTLASRPRARRKE